MEKNSAVTVAYKFYLAFGSGVLMMGADAAVGKCSAFSYAVSFEIGIAEP